MYSFDEQTSDSEEFVTLTKDSGVISERNDIAVEVSLIPGSSATLGSDFTIAMLGMTIEFSPDQQTRDVSITILQDLLPEGVESFSLSVDSVGFAFDATRVDTFETTQVSIIDNDGRTCDVCGVCAYSETSLSQTSFKSPK